MHVEASSTPRLDLNLPITLSPRPLAPGLRAQIEHAVAFAFTIEPEALRQPTRGPARVAFARQVAMYLAHVGCSLTLTETGRLFERDRTTVAHACSVVEDRRDDVNLDVALDWLERLARCCAGPRLPLPMSSSRECTL